MELFSDQKEVFMFADSAKIYIRSGKGGDEMCIRDRYNAVNHSHYTDPKELEIVTLKNAVYMNMKNDQAFLLDMQLNL